MVSPRLWVKLNVWNLRHNQCLRYTCDEPVVSCVRRHSVEPIEEPKNWNLQSKVFGSLQLKSSALRLGQTCRSDSWIHQYLLHKN